MPRKKNGANRVVVQNAAKTLAANIRFASVDDPISSIVVTSSIPNEGKTFVSVELARALAAGGKRVLLLEGDMHKRSLAARLGVHGRHGIYDVLSGEADIDEALIATDTPNLYFLDCEPNIPNPTDLISSKRFRGLLQGLRRSFGYVVIDTPPVAAFVDSSVLSSMVDATLLVVRENYVGRDELVAAYSQLKQAGANVVGTVINCHDREAGSYGYGRYGSYYEDSRDSGGPVSLSEVDDNLSAGALRTENSFGQPARRGAQSSSLHPIRPGTQTVSPDSTAQFIAGYQSRIHTDD